jgi:hypothetical protein
MNRRTFVLLGVATSMLVASAAIVPAARLEVSTVTVEVLSVDPQSFQRDEVRRESFKDGTISTINTWTEKTAVIAKAQIKAVVFNDHGLSPGTIIDIQYEFVRGGGPVYVPPAPEVKAGETWTVDIFGGGTSFKARGWKRPQPGTRPASISGGP